MECWEGTQDRSTCSRGHNKEGSGPEEPMIVDMEDKGALGHELQKQVALYLLRLGPPWLVATLHSSPWCHVFLSQLARISPPSLAFHPWFKIHAS